MSPSPTIKASWKEHKGNKNAYFSPFWGSIWWKKEWDSDKSKTVTVVNYPNSQIMESC